MENTNETTVDKETAWTGFPWRRYFARSFDISVYSAIWWFMGFMVFRWNMLGWAWRNLIMSVLMMLVFEPILLRIFGTTPGKAIFGIRILEDSGRKLSIMGGFLRILGVFSRGYGFFIPIYSIYRLYKSYRMCSDECTTEWDRAEGTICHVNGSKFPLRVLGFLLGSVLLAVISVIMVFAADMPRHHGDLTLEQLHGNLRQYSNYHNILNIWSVEIPDNVVWIGQIPDIEIIETDGFVTEIILIQEDMWFLTNFDNHIRALMVSFLGAQPEMNFVRMHFSGGALDTLFSSRSIMWSQQQVINFTMAGIEINYEIQHDATNGSSVRFSMRKLP